MIWSFVGWKYARRVPPAGLGHYLWVSELFAGLVTANNHMIFFPGLVLFLSKCCPHNIQQQRSSSRKRVVDKNCQTGLVLCTKASCVGEARVDGCKPSQWSQRAVQPLRYVLLGQFFVLFMKKYGHKIVQTRHFSFSTDHYWVNCSRGQRDWPITALDHWSAPS